MDHEIPGTSHRTDASTGVERKLMIVLDAVNGRRGRGRCTWSVYLLIRNGACVGK